ncbi:MAG: YfhO family protein [Anaerolineaceae bacterium]|nr:YfhO family protein [Anaerolineaceae bacterium]MCB9101075.1 YfhO family protein [Anaerolineales bacterium]
MWKVKPNVSRWPDVVLVLILTLLPSLFFWRLVTPNPADRMRIAAGDFTEQYFPLRAFTAGQWVSGQLPLWNPYLYGGQPALADIQSGALYPPHIIQALLLGWGGPLLGREIGFPVEALEWQVIFHFSVAAVGTYLFARQLILSHWRRGFSRRGLVRQARCGGLMASLVFTYSGYLTGFPVQQMTILSVSAWLPWVLWGLSVALARPFRAALRPIAWSALAFALALLAGHPQTVLYVFYLTLAYTLFRGFSDHSWTNKGEAKAEAKAKEIRNSPASYYRYILRNLGVWLTITILGTSIAAAQLLPTLEFIGLSLRADLSYEAVSAGLPLTELVSILYPGFFGGSPEYVGIAPLVLIALALILARPRGEVYFWAGAGLISLLLAFGGRLFVYPLFYLLAPGFDAVRQQERAFLVYSFSAAILAGFGTVVLAGPLSKRAYIILADFEQRLRIVALVAVILTAFFIYGSTVATARGDEVNLFFGVLRHHLFGLLILGGMLLLVMGRRRWWLPRLWGIGLLVVLVAYNLFTVNWQFNLEPRQIPGPFTPIPAVQFLQEHLDPPLGRVASGGLLPGGNSTASVYHLQDLTGNTPLQLASVDTFLQRLPAWRAWQLMNVRYIADQRDIGDAGLSLAFTNDELKIYQMGDPFDRAWLVGQVEVEADFDAALERLAADDFDLRRTAVVVEPLAVTLAGDASSSVQMDSFSANELSLTINTTAPQLLVVSQIDYPGWQATLDGQEVELLQVDAVLQGIVVPAGPHSIRIKFWPGTFAAGLWLSAIGSLLCLAMMIGLRLKG